MAVPDRETYVESFEPVDRTSIGHAREFTLDASKSILR
jgi:hypothetical protein